MAFQLKINTCSSKSRLISGREFVLLMEINGDIWLESLIAHLGNEQITKFKKCQRNYKRSYKLILKIHVYIVYTRSGYSGNKWTQLQTLFALLIEESFVHNIWIVANQALRFTWAKCVHVETVQPMGAALTIQMLWMNYVCSCFSLLPEYPDLEYIDLSIIKPNKNLPTYSKWNLMSRNIANQPAIILKMALPYPDRPYFLQTTPPPPHFI